MKHVVFAHRKLSFGGGERVLLEQVAALAELPVKVTVLFRKEPKRRDIEAELRTRNPNVAEVLHLPGGWGCFQWMRQNRADLLVACNHKGMQRALPWLARSGVRIPTLVTLHEHYPRHLAKYRSIRNLVDRWILTWDFQEAVKTHLGTQPCSVIHPLYLRPKGLNSSPETRSAARIALGIPLDAMVAGYVGQIDGRKDPVATLRLAELLEKELQRPLHLVFAGREEEDTSLILTQAVAKSPLKDRVVRLGRVPDTGQAFDALDVYLMTSRNEGFFPLALIEALERGVPIMVPTVGGIATVLKEGQGGFLMRKPDDRHAIAVEILAEGALRLALQMKDPQGWEIQRQRARELASRLTSHYDAAANFRGALASWL